MAKIRYFAEYKGEAVELTNISHDGHIRTTVDHFFGRAPDGTKLQAQRMVTFKSNPSRHECDARCMNASGRSMQCECSCGGKNHGRGSFTCVAA
jgi:hypothetical protein